MTDRVPVQWIAERKALEAVCQQASKAPFLAVDTEADSFHSYHAKVCLIQLSFDGEHVLVDPLSLSHDDLAPLGTLLADPEVPKIFHGADYDLRMLQKDFGFSVRGLADTQAAAQVLGEKHTSLAALVAKELGVQLDKRQQRADWARRPLPQEMLAYAVDDTRYLKPLLERLLVRVYALNRGSWWEEECKALERVVYEPPPEDPWAFLRLKGVRNLSPEALGRLAALWRLREELARAQDIPPFRIFSSELLIALATDPPVDLGVLGATRGLAPRVFRKWGRHIFEVLRQATPLTPPPAQPRVEDRELERLVARLRQARDRLAQELGLDPGFLAPRWALESVAKSKPKDLEGWVACLGRRWRAEVLQAPLSQVLAQEG